MTWYRKVPVEVEARQWDGRFVTAGAITEWVGERAAFYEVNETPHRLHPEIRIDTLEGMTTASPGDYIIKGTHGEFYPCKPDIFEATYEAVEQ